MNHQEIYNESDKGIRLDIFLLEYLKNISRTKIQKLINKGLIRIDDFIVKPSYKLKGKENIYVEYAQFETNHDLLGKENIPIEIIYEDSELLAINKKAGMVVHPGAGNKNGTLLNGLLYHFDSLSNLNSSRPGIIHRLDKNTSGIMLIAKNDESHYFLSEQFASRTIKRTYVALVWGDVKEEKGTITGNIGRNKKNRKIMTVFQDENEGKHAVTHYEVLERFRYVTLVKCHLETGRTHQIRVHLDHISHPVLGDPLYGYGYKTRINKLKSSVKVLVEKQGNSQALHAYKLGFEHPSTGEKLIFETDPPENMKSIIESF